MAYTTLKAAIQAAIKNNDNEEITGNVLQGVLLSIVNSVGDGFNFAGVATPSTNPGTPDGNMFWIGGKGTYTNFGSTIQILDGYLGVFKWDGSAFSRTSVKIGGSGGAFDVSDYTGNRYASLSAALAAVPADVKAGGMSIKFINSGTGKYEQWRLMATSWSNVQNDWQGVDNEPIEGSINLVQSGGVEAEITPLEIQIKQRQPFSTSVLSGGYINNSGVITSSSAHSVKYAYVNKGELIYVRTDIHADFGGYAFFLNVPTLQSASVKNVKQTDVFVKIPYDCYIAVSGETTQIAKKTIAFYGNILNNTLNGLSNDAYKEANILYQSISVYQDSRDSLPGYINSLGINAITSTNWTIKYAYVTKGTLINSEGGMVSGSFRAGFTDLEPVSGFALDTIIATDTIFPYIAERSGYFCISNSGSFTLQTKTAVPELARISDIILKDQRLLPIQTYEGYYIRNSGSWQAMETQAVRVYSVEAGKTYYIESHLNSSYMFVGWCINLPSLGTVPDIVVRYVDGISNYQKAPASANYMLITGSIELYTADEMLNAYDVNIPFKNQALLNCLSPNIYVSKNRHKIALYIGDSISTGYNWRDYIKFDYGLDYQKNISQMPASVGGIFLRPKENEVQGLESIWWRCAQHRILNAGYTPSIISIFGGTNDMSSSSLPIGTSQDIPFVDNSGDFTQDTIDASQGWPAEITYCSALKGCILMIMRDFPSAEIIIPTVLYCSGSYGTWTPAGQSLIASEVIAKRQVEISQIMGVRFVPWYWSERTEKTIDIFARDGVHPSVSGARVMARWFADYMPL